MAGSRRSTSAWPWCEGDVPRAHSGCGIRDARDRTSQRRARRRAMVHVLRQPAVRPGGPSLAINKVVDEGRAGDQPRQIIDPGRGPRGASVQGRPGEAAHARAERRASSTRSMSGSERVGSGLNARAPPAAGTRVVESGDATCARPRRLSPRPRGPRSPDAHPTRRILPDLPHDVGRQDHGPPDSRRLADQREERPGGPGRRAVRRLVEQQHPRLVHERTGEHHRRFIQSTGHRRWSRRRSPRPSLEEGVCLASAFLTPWIRANSPHDLPRVRPFGQASLGRDVGHSLARLQRVGADGSRRRCGSRLRLAPRGSRSCAGWWSCRRRSAPAARRSRRPEPRTTGDRRDEVPRLAT